MDLIALLLLTLVGYSSGAIVGGRKRLTTPRPFDLALIVILWIGALFSRPAIGKWAAVGIWFAIAFVLALIRTIVRRRGLPRAEQAAPLLGKNLPARLWSTWKQFAKHMGNFQGRVLLALFYFVIVTPFGLLVRLVSDPLRIKQAHSTWLDRSSPKADLEHERNQF